MNHWCAWSYSGDVAGGSRGMHLTENGPGLPYDATADRLRAWVQSRFDVPWSAIAVLAGHFMAAQPSLESL